MRTSTPHSLLWRLGGFALGMGALSLALHMTVMVFALEPLGTEVATALAGRTRIAHALLTATAPGQRQSVAQGLTNARFSVVQSDASAAQRKDPTRLLAGHFIETLLQQLGPGYELLDPAPVPGAPDERSLRIVFNIDGQPWLVEHRTHPPTEVFLGTGLSWLLVAAAALGASLWLGLRFVVRPLAQLTERIATQGGELQALSEPAGASAEVRSLVESFNSLVDRLQTANRIKQQLLAGVSHDLRTPLARLRLRIETQCTPEVAAEAEEELRAVEHIVSQFLAFVHGDTRADAGPPGSVRNVATQVVASYAEQGQSVRWLAAAADKTLNAMALRRVLTNLIDNALAYGRAPIDVVWRDGAAGERELVVWDHGPGLTAEQFKAAQEPFVRLSAQNQIGHCGLGLAIVAQITQQWGGQLLSRHDEAGRFGIAVVWPA